MTNKKITAPPSGFPASIITPPEKKESNADALGVFKKDDVTYLVSIPFNTESMEVTGPIAILAEDKYVTEVRERFRIEAAKRDFV